MFIDQSGTTCHNYPQLSMDWFKGEFTGKPHDLHGKITMVSG
jgi:hypothetical protein